MAKQENIIDRKELVRMTGIKSGNITNYVKRGKLKERPDGKFDLNNATNAAFVGVHGWKGEVKAGTAVAAEIAEKTAKPTKEKKLTAAPAMNKKKAAVKPKIVPKKAAAAPVEDDDSEDEDYELPDGDQDPSLMEELSRNTAMAEARYKAARAIKTEKEAELSDIRVEKVRGSIIPTDIVIPIFVQHNQHILNAQKIADDEILNDLAHRFSIGGDDVAKLRGEFVKRRNEAMKKATEASEKGIDAQVKNFIDTKV